MVTACPEFDQELLRIPDLMALHPFPRVRTVGGCNKALTLSRETIQHPAGEITPRRLREFHPLIPTPGNYSRTE